MSDLKHLILSRYKDQKGLKLNVACGGRILDEFINIDKNERSFLVLKIDVRDGLPFTRESCAFIYAEQFLEHLTWLEGKKFLKECYRCLEIHGILRIVIPDYKLIFQKYVQRDDQFFQIYKDELNQLDLPYYEDQGNEERQRKFTYNIEVLDWFTHQYGEHVCLYDLLSLQKILNDVGFHSVHETERKDIDSSALSRIESSLYVEAIK